MMSPPVLTYEVGFGRNLHLTRFKVQSTQGAPSGKIDFTDRSGKIF
jgi:hypothetical protein